MKQKSLSILDNGSYLLFQNLGFLRIARSISGYENIKICRDCLTTASDILKILQPYNIQTYHNSGNDPVEIQKTLDDLSETDTIVCCIDRDRDISSERIKRSPKNNKKIYQFQELYVFSLENILAHLSRGLIPMKRIDLSDEIGLRNRTPDDHFFEMLRMASVVASARSQEFSNCFNQILRASGYFAQKPGTYIVVAPPGFGKTSLLVLARINGVRPIPKLTTRPYRSKIEASLGETESVSESEFDFLRRAGRLYGLHNSYGRKYAYRIADIDRAIGGDEARILTTSSTDLAFDLRKQCGERVKVAMVVRAPSEIQTGLEIRLISQDIGMQRLDYYDGCEVQLLENSVIDDQLKKFWRRILKSGYSGAKKIMNLTEQDAREYIRRMKYLAEDTKRRLLRVRRDYERMIERIREADIVLDSPSIEENSERLLQEIYVEPK